MGASRWLEANTPVGTSMSIDIARARSEFNFFMVVSSLSGICGRSMEDLPPVEWAPPAFIHSLGYERSSQVRFMRRHFFDCSLAQELFLISTNPNCAELRIIW